LSEIDVHALVINALKAVAIILWEDGIDTIVVDKDLHSLRWNFPPNIIDDQINSLRVNAVDRNHIRTVCAHINIAGVLHHHLGTIVTVRQNIGRRIRDGG